LPKLKIWELAAFLCSTSAGSLVSTSPPFVARGGTQRTTSEETCRLATPALAGVAMTVGFGTSRLRPDGRFRITSTVEEIAEPRAIAGPSKVGGYKFGAGPKDSS
jgi:hypothetical protein